MPFTSLGFAVWSAGASETNITFKNNLATFPRYPKTWLASCFAQYGGNRTAFLGNRCVGTGERGMIYFEQGGLGVGAVVGGCYIIRRHIGGVLGSSCAVGATGSQSYGQPSA